MNNLPKVALGTWSWGTGFAGGDQVFGNTLTASDLKHLFEEAMKSGLTLWDTAVVYGMGASETMLAQFTKQFPREQVLISTKFTPQIAAQYNHSVEEMLHSSLERFDTNYIDIYWIHNPMDIEKWTPQLVPLLKSGKVKRVGVSNHNLEEIKKANSILDKEGFKISAVQNHFSLLYRSSEEAGILDYCHQHDMEFFAYMVLEQGALSGKYTVKNPLPEGSGRGNTYNKVLPQLEELTNAMKEIGAKQNASVAQVAIAYAIYKHTLPIIGVTKIAHIQDALHATNMSLTQDEVNHLENLAAKARVDTRGAWEKPMI